MKTDRKLWQCPACKGYTRDFPAISRRDNKTEICSDCGTREAMEDYIAERKQKAIDRRVLNIVAFLALMQGGGGLKNKSSDYIWEKYKRYCGSLNEEEWRWGLDDDNMKTLEAWRKKWASHL